MNCIIGYTGFIGSTILRSCGENLKIDVHVNSKNIQSIVGKKFETLILACLPAEKWRVNLEPESDLANILKIQNVLRTVSAKQTILFSTVDVYADVLQSDERTTLFSKQAYGWNRRIFEEFIVKNFPSVYVLRLPGLFGEGLKKNYIYDLMNRNQLDKINLDAEFQWYPMCLLVKHLMIIIREAPGIYNLVTQPINTYKLVQSVFPELLGRLSRFDKPTKYNVRTINNIIFSTGDRRGYIMADDEVLTYAKRFVHGALA